MTRQWVKIWINESLRGTIRFDLNAAERGVWYDLIVLAGASREPGIIAPGPGTSYPTQWIAATLNVPLPLLNTVLQKCVETERIEMNGHGIKIINWSKYQSEYERQKPYRKKQAEQIAQSKFDDQGKYTHMVQRSLPEDEGETT